jgi:hypothetical protein
VRQYFFKILAHYLAELPNCIKDADYIKSLKEEEVVFAKYFDQKKYIDSFDGVQEQAFAKQLLVTS